MTMIPTTDLGGHVKSAAAGASVDGSGDPLVIVAAGAGDGVAQTGPAIDRLCCESGVLAVSFQASLAAAETLSLAVSVEESEDNVSYDAPVVLHASAVVATGAGGGSQEAGVLEIDENLRPRKRYVRYTITPDLSAGATDTAVYAAALVLGGCSELPPV